MENLWNTPLMTYLEAWRAARAVRCPECSSLLTIVPDPDNEEQKFLYRVICTNCHRVMRGDSNEILAIQMETEREQFSCRTLSDLVLSRIDQFWSMLHIPIRENGGADLSVCWNWTRSVDRSGYGWFRVGKRVWRAHRYAYFITHPAEPLKTGWVICHTCDNPGCSNPAHIYQGSYAANYRDALLRGRLSIKMTVGKVLRLIRLAQKGYSIMELAVLFGIQDWQVAAILRGYSWGNITGKQPKHPRKRKHTDNEEGQ